MRNEEQATRRTRRSFIKKSAAAAIGAKSALIFGGLVTTAYAQGSGDCTNIAVSGNCIPGKGSNAGRWECLGSCTPPGGGQWTGIFLVCDTQAGANPSCIV